MFFSHLYYISKSQIIHNFFQKMFLKLLKQYRSMTTLDSCSHQNGKQSFTSHHQIQLASILVLLPFFHISFFDNTAHFPAHDCDYAISAFLCAGFQLRILRNKKSCSTIYLPISASEIPNHTHSTNNVSYFFCFPFRTDAATPNHDDDDDDDYAGDDRAGYFGIKWVKLFLFHESFNGLHTSGPSLTEGPRSFVALVHS